MKEQWDMNRTGNPLGLIWVAKDEWPRSRSRLYAWASLLLALACLSGGSPRVMGQAPTSGRDDFLTGNGFLLFPRYPSPSVLDSVTVPVFAVPDLSSGTNRLSGNGWSLAGQPPGQEANLTSKGEPLRLPLLADSLFLFSEAKGNEEAGSSPKASSLGAQTGVALGLPAPKDAELWLRCGSQFSAKGSQGPDHAPDPWALPFSSQLLRLEVEGRWSFLGPLRLEWQGAASPAVTALEHDRLEHDLRLVCPLGEIGQLQMGTKHLWENKSESKPWSESGQLYGGFRLKW
jgi:hypothetical protein